MEPVEEVESVTERGKRKSAFRFEVFALFVAALVLDRMWRGEMDASSSAALTGFGTTVFIAALGYAASLRGMDAVTALKGAK